MTGANKKNTRKKLERELEAHHLPKTELRFSKKLIWIYTTSKWVLPLLMLHLCIS